MGQPPGTIPMPQVSFRWIPLASMWQRGYPIDEIAAVYGVTTVRMRERIKTLQSVYKLDFPERRGRTKLVRLGAAAIKKPHERRTGKLPKHRTVKRKALRRAASR